MMRRAEADQLLTLFEGSPRAAVLAARLGARWVLDRLRYPRGTRLTMGNGLVAAMFHQLVRRSGEVWFGARARALITDGDRVAGAVVDHGGEEVRIGARRGVVLAGGGFAANADLRAAYLPQPVPEYTRAVDGATGDSLALAASTPPAWKRRSRRPTRPRAAASTTSSERARARTADSTGTRGTGPIRI
jgi:3-oxosteroid 1-dehydrogenase